MSLHRTKKNYRPRVEVLEDRTTPSVSVNPAGTTLNISGNNDNDTVTVRDNGDGDVTVTFAGGSFTGDNFTRIRVNLSGGNDRFTYRQTGNRTRNMDLRCQMQQGNDLFTGRIQADILAGRTLKIQVEGGQGADGVDLFANTDVDLQAGATFQALLFGGGSVHRDRCDFNYQGELDGVLRYTLDLGPGDETGDTAGFGRATIRADLGSSGQVGIVGESASVLGGLGNDSVSNFVFIMPGDVVLVNATVDGGDGTDTGSRTLNVTTVNCETNFVV